MGDENQSFRQEICHFVLPLKTLLMEHIQFYTFFLIFLQNQSIHQMNRDVYKRQTKSRARAILSSTAPRPRGSMSTGVVLTTYVPDPLLTSRIPLEIKSFTASRMVLLPTPNLSPNSNSLGSLAPVSYTHLDRCKFVLPCLIAVSYNRILAGIRLQHRVINHVFNSHFHSPFPFEALIRFKL